MSERNTLERIKAFHALCTTASPGEIAEALRNGASPDARDEDRMTALMWAARRNPDPEAVRTLLAAGAEL